MEPGETEHNRTNETDPAARPGPLASGRALGRNLWSMETSSERRAQLNAVKLAALVRDALTPDQADVVPAAFPGGAALVVGDEAWVLLDEQPARGLGGALAWSSRAGSSVLNIVAESSTGLLARRAEHFAMDIRVWHLEGRTLLAAIAEPLPGTTSAPQDHVALMPLIEGAGAVARVEHGVVAGEVEGLEVCRVVTDENTGEARLEVGVGAHDREAFAMLHGNLPTPDALRQVVDAVRPHRTPGADPHPLNRLAVERALRERAIASPHLVGASMLSAAEPPVPRANLKDPVPCVATGSDADGRSLIAVFSSGVDLDVVPFASDARRFHSASAGDADLVVVVPERDRVPVTVALGDLLDPPARVVAWPA